MHEQYVHERVGIQGKSEKRVIIVPEFAAKHLNMCRFWDRGVGQLAGTGRWDLLSLVEMTAETGRSAPPTPQARKSSKIYEIITPVGGKKQQSNFGPPKKYLLEKETMYLMLDPLVKSACFLFVGC